MTNDKFEEFCENYSNGVLNDKDNGVYKVLALNVWNAVKNTWYPIKSAPKDTPVIIYEPNTIKGYIGSAILRSVDNRWFCCATGSLDVQPTHWQPSPADPEEVCSDS